MVAEPGESEKQCGNRNRSGFPPVLSHSHRWERMLLASVNLAITHRAFGLHAESGRQERKRHYPKLRRDLEHGAEAVCSAKFRHAIKVARAISHDSSQGFVSVHPSLLKIQ